MFEFRSPREDISRVKGDNRIFNRFNKDEGRKPPVIYIITTTIFSHRIERSRRKEGKGSNSDEKEEWTE